MIDRSKLGLVLGAAGAVALIAAAEVGLARSSGPAHPAAQAAAATAASSAPEAEPAGCCQGRAGKHDDAGVERPGAGVHDPAKCPMSGKAPAETAPKPDAAAKKCPHAGAHGSMAAGKAKAAPSLAKDGDAKPLFACPMHPEVTSTKTDRCPKCGMFLEAKKP